MISLAVGPSDADDEDAHEKIFGRNSGMIDVDALERVADALNLAVVEVDGKPTPLLREHCRAKVEGSVLIVMDSSSVTPNPIDVTGPGGTMEVLEKIAHELKEIELIPESVALYVIES